MIRCISINKTALLSVILAMIVLSGCTKKTDQTNQICDKTVEALTEIETDTDVEIKENIQLDNKENILEKYEDTYGFENQNLHARVKQNGQWGIVNSYGELVVACEYDYINELPYIFTYASGVKNGHAVIINLNPKYEYKERHLEKYRDIEEIQFGLFANVKNDKGYAGVISVGGEVLLETEYASISAKMTGDNVFILTAESFEGEHNEFLLQFNENGKLEIREL